MTTAIGTALAAFSAGIEAINAIGSLDFGATGGVTLGDFDFAGFEVPAQIAFGGRQAMTVHRLPGGERVVDLMGPDEGVVEWSGTFLGDQADSSEPALRAQRLDQMRAEGKPLPLTWGEFYYTVIIAEFTADTRYSMVPYRISCLVLRNESTAPGSSTSTDLTSSVSSDILSALGAAPQDGQVALTGAQAALAALGPIAPGSATMMTALASVTQANTVLSGLRAGAELNIGAIAENTVGLVGGSTDLQNAVSATGELAQLTQSQGFLGRLSVNLGGAPWQ